MGLAEVVTAFTANLVRLGYADAAEFKADTLMPIGVGQLAVLLGPEYLLQNDAPPRIVFVPGEVGKDKFTAAEALGGATRQMLTRQATAEVHVWGKDYAQAEALVNDAIIALRLSAQGSFQISVGGFVAQTENLQFGREYVFGMQLSIPIVKPTLQTAPNGVFGKHKGIMGSTVAC